ncbi:hypothetical protein [Niabella sp.]|uniref:hypothetical protein n=1 Tax=Niabella sp. TaxID=1962976 RepID=UPI0026154A0A|nr:hypothetical protein [Niabella sp.]
MKAIFTFILFSGIFLQPVQSQKSKFPDIIKGMELRIDQSLSSLGGWEDLINIPDILFLEFTQNKSLHRVFQHPKLYQNDILNYIKNPKKKWEYKYYVLGLLQGLCIEDYLVIFPIVYKVVDNAIKKNSIKKNEDFLPWKGYPYIDMLYLLVDQDNLSREVKLNFKNPQVKKYLIQIQKDHTIPAEIRNHCNFILTGHAALVKDKERSPLFTCK